MQSGQIVFENVRYTYDGAHYALDGVDLSIAQGDFVCVLGGNGSGKSTLAKHMNALLVPDEGTVRVNGLDSADPANTYEIRSSVGMVFQNPDDQIVASIIEDDVAFGPENLGIPTEELRARVTKALEEVGLQGFEKKETAALSGGQKQRVAIAGALAMHPQVLVLDEASAMLDPRGRKGLMRVCREINEMGMTVVFITHFMEEAANANRVIVLEAGKVAADGTPADVLAQVELLESLALEAPFAADMSIELRRRGLDVSMHVDEETLINELAALPAGASSGDTDEPENASIDSEVSTSAAVGEFSGSEALIRFEGVSYSYVQKTVRKKRGQTKAEVLATWGNAPDEIWALRDIDLQVAKGEFLGIAGHTGSGKSTLVQLANGLLKPTLGRVIVNGYDIADKAKAASARQNVGLVFQYPERQLFAATVREDVAFGPRNMGLDEQEIEQRVCDALQMVHLDVDEIGEASPFALSGGQQRRVALAGVLAMKPTALILDEPIAGLDPRSRMQLLAFIRELHDEKGFTIIIVSHNMDDLARLCERILVLNQGREFALGSPSSVFADEERLRSVGLGVPHAAHLANELNGRGFPLGSFAGVPNAGELADRIARIVDAGEGR